MILKYYLNKKKEFISDIYCVLFRNIYVRNNISNDLCSGNLFDRNYKSYY